MLSYSLFYQDDGTPDYGEDWEDPNAPVDHLTTHCQLTIDRSPEESSALSLPLHSTLGLSLAVKFTTLSSFHFFSGTLTLGLVRHTLSLLCRPHILTPDRTPHRLPVGRWHVFWAVFQRTASLASTCGSYQVETSSLRASCRSLTHVSACWSTAFTLSLGSHLPILCPVCSKPFWLSPSRTST